MVTKYIEVSKSLEFHCVLTHVTTQETLSAS
jgi:hypothetical protein